MDQFKGLFKKIAALFWTASEAGLAVVSVILVIYLLLGGDSGTFTLSVVSNLSLLIEALTPQAIVSVAIIFVAYAWMRRNN